MCSWRQPLTNCYSKFMWKSDEREWCTKSTSIKLWMHKYSNFECNSVLTLDLLRNYAIGLIRFGHLKYLTCSLVGAILEHFMRPKMRTHSNQICMCKILLAVASQTTAVHPKDFIHVPRISTYTAYTEKTNIGTWHFIAFSEEKKKNFSWNKWSITICLS